MKKSRGFTLIEILVALLIFAIMGVLAALSLHSIIRSHEQLKKADHELLQLQITMTLLRRDISEVINRPIRNQDDEQEPAFLSQSGTRITFTRTGLMNPFNDSRQSNMQRVGYALEGNNLVRLTWGALDQPPKSVPESQTLLSNVASLQWQFVADNGSTSQSWPPSTGSNMQTENSPLPKAVLVVMHIKNEGVLQGVFPIPARGVNAISQTPTLP
jgi:general secretion pathway protein J